MAEPGDPKGPAPHADDHDPDAHIGFASPASLAGRSVERPAPEVPAEPEPASEPDLFDPPEAVPFQPQVETAPVAPIPGPFERSEVAASAAEPRFSPRETVGRRVETPAVPMGMYAVYVLILLAVPTLGLSALVALLAVARREAPDDALAASHFVYQQRTLYAAAVAAVLGAVLVVVNIGVFVLFVLALWVLARGAYGVLKLKAGRAVPNPRGWLF